MEPDAKNMQKRIKFRSISTTTEPVLDSSSLRQRSKSEQKYKKVDSSESDGK